MTHRLSLRRAGLAVAGAATATVLAAAPAMAHHCFIPMYSLKGPVSANWFVVSAELGAQFEHGYVAACPEAVDAGYAALRAEKLPVGIKIRDDMVIGDPKHTGRMNPNGANGKGLEYFEAGSELPFQMIDTWVEGANSVDCEAV
ncbi:hypothetical protein N802_03770 [Knoellia sinensis KCTC 19936]|uniref:Uncharacterized protein n=1 Tax=Knoellia sinensis KCTC 19936 TaxID=1385520 RepID=A0A0A0J2C9_9MICO|nr:hypothetical protein [Knoellia sinensis]KGN31495.1 hypothetical protein N802_03770 [Knoellia sinensis KCTC 19936]